MLRSIILVAILILVATPAFAQRGGFTPEKMQQRQERQIADIAEKLALSDEQKPVFLQIMKDASDAKVEIFRSMRDGGDRQGIRKKMQAQTEKANEALKEVLTEDQMTRLLRYQQQGRRSGGRRQN